MNFENHCKKIEQTLLTSSSSIPLREKIYQEEEDNGYLNGFRDENENQEEEEEEETINERRRDFIGKFIFFV